MTGENLESNQAPEQATGWESLSDATFDKAQTEANLQAAQEQIEAVRERQELERETVDKITKNHKAKNIFKKLALGVILSATLIGGAMMADRTPNPDRGAANRAVSVQEVVDHTQSFVDINSDDLVWSEMISNNAGGIIELSENTIGQASNITGFEEVSSIQMDWWQGQGDMYRATDTNGDGTWDTASRLNPYTNETETIQLNQDGGASAMTMQQIQGQFK